MSRQSFRSFYVLSIIFFIFLSACDERDDERISPSPNLIHQLTVDLYSDCFEWPGTGVSWEGFANGTYHLESSGTGNNPIIVYYIDSNNMGRAIGVLPGEPETISCSGESLVAFWIDSYKSDNSGTRTLTIKDENNFVVNTLDIDLYWNCFEWTNNAPSWQSFTPGTYSLQSSGPSGSNNPILVYYIDSANNGRAIGILPDNDEVISCSGECLVAFWIDSAKWDNTGEITLSIYD
jgi:hypothetical protein